MCLLEKSAKQKSARSQGSKYFYRILCFFSSKLYGETQEYAGILYPLNINNFYSFVGLFEVR